MFARASAGRKGERADAKALAGFLRLPGPATGKSNVIVARAPCILSRVKRQGLVCLEARQVCMRGNIASVRSHLVLNIEIAMRA